MNERNKKSNCVCVYKSKRISFKYTQIYFTHIYYINLKRVYNEMIFVLGSTEKENIWIEKNRPARYEISLESEQIFRFKQTYELKKRKTN